MVKRFTNPNERRRSPQLRRRVRPTIVDIARIAGVSPTTVSYVLSGPSERAARISEATTNRVLEVVADVGYVPNHPARSLRLQRTNRVLFLGNRLNSLYSQGRAAAIEARLAPHHLELDVQIGTGSAALARALSILDQHMADGLIAEAGDHLLPELRAAGRAGHAVVAVGPSMAVPELDVASTDYSVAIRAAMEHLVSRQRRTYLLMSIRREWSEDDRIGIAHAALLSKGVAESDIMIRYCPHDSVLAYQEAVAILPKLPGPVAVYPGSDVSAIGVLWASLHCGLRVPEEVAIVGHGNNPESRITVPQLTSIGPVNPDFGRAADLMITRLADPSIPGRHVSEASELFIRSSS